MDRQAIIDVTFLTDGGARRVDDDEKVWLCRKASESGPIPNSNHHGNQNIKRSLLRIPHHGPRICQMYSGVCTAQIELVEYLGSSCKCGPFGLRRYICLRVGFYSPSLMSYQDTGSARLIFT